MKGEENLVPFSQRSKEEARELGAKGGRNSGKARLRKKRGRELLQTLLAMKTQDPKILKELRELGISQADATNEVALHIKQMQKAAKTGDTAAYSAIIKAAGYEKQEIDINATVTRPKVVFEDEEDAVQD